VKMNELLMRIQYCLFMVIFFVLFVLVSLVLIPAAWIVGIIDKVKNLKNVSSGAEKIMNLGLFCPFGMEILTLDLLVDMTYFW